MDEGVEDYHSFHVFPPTQVVYLVKRICRAVFMEERGIQARNGRSCSEESLRSHFETITFGRSPSPHFQSASHQVRDSLCSLNRRRFVCADVSGWLFVREAGAKEGLSKRTRDLKHPAPRKCRTDADAVIERVPKFTDQIERRA
jgi:hypothetical protein